ncbi:MAG: glycosyltransferase family 1 protein [Chloroflexota bacterium]
MSASDAHERNANKRKQGLLPVALDTTYAGVNPTGVGIYSARLADELRRNSARLGIRLICYGPACVPQGPHRTIPGTIQEWPVYTHGILPVRLLATRPGIVHSTSHIGPLWGPGRLIVTVHDLIFMRYPADYNPAWLAITRAILPSVLRRATAIIADSQATKDDIQTFFGVHSGKIVVIYPGMDQPSAAAQATENQYRRNNDDKPYILCLGPWVRRKNIEVVLRAFSILAPVIPDLRLILTGDRPPGMKGYSRAELFSYIDAKHNSRIELTGYVTSSEKHQLIAGASALCYPSRIEGFGLPPLEAMAAGTPVVASNTPAVAEVTGGAALLVNPDDPFDWARTLEQLLLNADLRAALRKAGLSRSRNFTWQRCAEQTARLYHRVAERV